MGAGRMKVDDELDYSVGYVLQVRIGDQVDTGTPLCVLHARSDEDADRAEAAVRAAITFGDQPCGRASNFYAVVTKDGVRRLGADS
jgi:thymidine phosphorylase